MAASREDSALHWIDPIERGIIPLDNFHISRSLGREMRREGFTIRTNTSFTEVVAACADRPETWINAPLTDLYGALHKMGHAHAIEVWHGDEMTGGVFGITLGGAFFGESMFSRRKNASKIALAFLVAHLRDKGFLLFDTQFLTQHLASLGAIEIPRARYRLLLAEALAVQTEFGAF